MHLHQMTPEQRYALSNMDKLIKFDQFRTSHLILNAVAGRIAELMHPYNYVSTMNLIGATGIGKTELMKVLISKRIRSKYPDVPNEVIYIEVPSFEGRGVPFAEIFIMGMEKLNEPLLDKKSNIILEEGRLKSVGKISDSRSLESAFKSALENRNIAAIILDEVRHLLPNRSKVALVNTFKTLSRKNCPKLINVGGYDTMDFLFSNEQLIQRGSTVHFPRYGSKSFVINGLGDVYGKSEFIEILKQHISIWPWPIIPDFLRWQDVIFENCLGVIGLLRKIMQKVLQRQTELGGNCSTIKIGAFLNPRGDLDRYIREFEKGEPVVAKFDCLFAPEVPEPQIVR
ncbi:P-loop NTPase family protein [Cupriavidus metallidurans]|uniref:TniB family NTP-binding protein n=1 Tax=Cupriavidus metallidurans TaxID=119219 RepID=UPI00055E6689|nr:TniB family NTP-binding protein [Cupriavidus metallidurans]